MNNQQNLWLRLTAPRSTNDDDARREYMAKVIFVFLVAVGLVFLVVFLLGWVMQTYPWVSFAIALGMELFLIGGWWLSDKGYWRFSSYIPPVLFFLLAVQVNIQWGISSIAMLQYTIAVLLAIILVGGITVWITLGLSIGVYLVVGWLHVQGSLPPPPIPKENFAFFVGSVSGMLIFIALLQWFYTRQFRHALTELAQHKAGLEKMIEDRTAELQQVLAQQDIILKNTAVGITLLVDRRFIWVNNRMEEVFGYTGEELKGLTTEIIYPTHEDYLQLGEDAYPILAKGEHYYCERLMKRKDGTQFWCTFAGKAINPDDLSQGSIWMLEDISQRKEMEEVQARLQQEIIDAQQRVIQELSTPVIPVMDRIIVMPLVGSIDSMRARDITRSLLAGISQHQAKVVILDVTGVGLMDTGIVNHLSKTIQAARLKGAQTIVTGISDTVAESIVDLGIDWSAITTLSDLQTGLVAALGSLGLHIEGDTK